MKKLVQGGLGFLKDRMPGKLSGGTVLNLALVGSPLLINSFDRDMTPEERARRNIVDVGVGLTSLRFKNGWAQGAYGLYLSAGMSRGVGKNLASGYQNYISQTSLAKMPFSHTDVSMIRADRALSSAAQKLGVAYNNDAFAASAFLNNR